MSIWLAYLPFAPVATGLLLAGCAFHTQAPYAAREDPVWGTTDVAGVAPIGRVHDNVRRSERD